jgi:hypothetical protein
MGLLFFQLVYPHTNLADIDCVTCVKEFIYDSADSLYLPIPY